MQTDPQIELANVENFKRFLFELLEICENTQNALIGVEAQQETALNEAIDFNEKALDEIEKMIEVLK